MLTFNGVTSERAGEILSILDKNVLEKLAEVLGNIGASTFFIEEVFNKHSYLNTVAYFVIPTVGVGTGNVMLVYVDEADVVIMGEARKGLKVTYTTDTRPCDNIVKFAKDSDLFICEGMYGSDDNLDNAVKNYHMTFSEAASLARDAHVEQMWLTHYSPGLVDPEKYISNATNIFKRTMCAYDTLSTVLEYQ